MEINKGKKLPYYVAAYNAVVAEFNSLADALEFAQAKSAKFTAGWWTVHDRTQLDEGGNPFTFGIFDNGVER